MTNLTGDNSSTSASSPALIVMLIVSPTFDEIFMDDYPLEITEKSGDLEKLLSNQRFQMFIDLCIQNHTRIGSKISGYLNANIPLVLGSDSEPFCSINSKFIKINIPVNCKYRDQNQQCQIPLVTKIKEFNFYEASRYAIQSLEKKLF